MTAAKRHPVRGFFGGLFLGLGVALLLVTTSQIALGTLTPLVVVALGVVVGVAWAMLGPVRGAERRVDTAPAPTPVPPPVVEPVGIVEPEARAEDTDAPGSEAVESTGDWEATHTAPGDGLATYAGAEEGGGENGRLEPGLPVQVVERNGDWARIVCSNGWAAWVDATKLVEGSSER